MCSVYAGAVYIFPFSYIHFNFLFQCSEVMSIIKCCLNRTLAAQEIELENQEMRSHQIGKLHYSKRINNKAKR